MKHPRSARSWSLLVELHHGFDEGRFSPASMKRPEVSVHGSVDPAPPSPNTDLEGLGLTLADENARMFERMRAMFALRNLGGVEAAETVCQAFSSSSALLRHEAAYVLGQMQQPEVVDQLMLILDDEGEHVMVRHEAAEALGAIGDPSSVTMLEKHLSHPMPEISESCEVALDLFNHVSKYSA